MLMNVPSPSYGDFKLQIIPIAFDITLDQYIFYSAKIHTVLSKTQLGNRVETNIYLLPCNAKNKDHRIDTL